MTKVYEIRGVVETSRIFRIGRATIRCTFTGGSVNESGAVPAVYITSDFAVQTIIEASKDFKEGFIKVKPIGEEVMKSDDVKITEEYPEVTNTQGAKEIMSNEPYNVPLADMPNKSVILNRATELGLKFPNWK